MQVTTTKSLLEQTKNPLEAHSRQFNGSMVLYLLFERICTWRHTCKYLRDFNSLNTDLTHYYVNFIMLTCYIKKKRLKSCLKKPLKIIVYTNLKYVFILLYDGVFFKHKPK